MQKRPFPLANNGNWFSSVWESWNPITFSCHQRLLNPLQCPSIRLGTPTLLPRRI